MTKPHGDAVVALCLAWRGRYSRRRSLRMMRREAPGRRSHRRPSSTARAAAQVKRGQGQLGLAKGRLGPPSTEYLGFK